eukprot:CAMPEP_0202918036 /NCGR_PEP_ID=MMETSP1392-20130828/72488_1 /ASSEMBLY_ACC=CAM_ASM_000868 /TAXON_ID=225041 /ORGANISM="Chlamydomonas chlamydogama, Strain SAG 11-48b" /LENGTH=264 /DNA_ID=CAMNT_0049610967 /DNA_START=223 /DNA_END=1017 /DNA_ORIENTATION=+
MTISNASITPAPAQASLLRFPANSLNNTYYLVRAGLSVSEERNITLTNPVWKTGGICGLSRTGIQQIINETLPALKELGACEDGCWLWPSITSSAYQTAEILASQLILGRNRIVPEYSFLDKRGLGDLEDLPLDQVEQQVADADRLDARWRPTPGTDGTPNESMTDVLVRMRQVISITETQYAGEDVLFISPDSYNLSALQAALLGIDLRFHSQFAVRPGQVRRLQLSDRSFDDRPRQVACPDPPQCRGLSVSPAFAPPTGLPP